MRSLPAGELKGVDTYVAMNHNDQPADVVAAAPVRLLIRDILPDDVLLGRGTHANINEGNIRFRKLVKTRGEEYRCATKRMRKDMIARAIINEVAERGGRFLQLVPLHSLELIGGNDDGDGRRAWKEADEEVIVLKAKQALRGRKEKAPTAKVLKKVTVSGVQEADE